MSFLKLYSIETKKLVRSKSLYVTLGIIFIFIIICTLMFEFLNASIAGDLADQMNEIGNSGLPAEEIVRQLEGQLSIFESTPHGKLDNKGYQLRSLIAAYKYIAANDLPVSTMVYDSSVFLFSKGAAGYLNTVLMVSGSIVMFYIIVLAANGIMSEINGGTMKTVLLRPVKRSALFSAKYAALFTVSSALILGSLVVPAIYALIRFDISASALVVPFNGTSAFLSNAYGIMAITFLFSLISNFAYMQLSYAVSNLFSNKTVGIITPVVLMLFGEFIVMLGVLTYLGYAGFLTNVTLIKYFSAAGMVYEGYNFFASLAVTVIWIAGLTTYNYMNFEKRDIN